MTQSEARDYEYWQRSICTETKAETKKEMKGTTVMGPPKDKDILDYVFVYGTLLKGQGNHNSFLGQSHCLGPGSTKDVFLMYDCGFPLCRLPGDSDNHRLAGHVIGEVYAVTKSTLAALDRLEGHPNFYMRTVTEIVEYPRKRIMMYHWNNPTGHLPEGVLMPNYPSKTHDWRVHRNKKAS